MPSITIINDNGSFSSSSSSTASLPAPASVLASSSTVNIIPHTHNHNHRPSARRKSALSSWLARHVPPRVVQVLGLHRLAARREQCSCPDCNWEREREDKEEEEGEEEEAADYAAFCNAFTASTSAWDKESPGHGCDKALTPASPLSTPLPLPPPGVITPSLHVATDKKPRPERGSKRGRCFGSLRSWCSRR